MMGGILKCFPQPKGNSMVQFQPISSPVAAQKLPKNRETSKAMLGRPFTTMEEAVYGTGREDTFC